MRTDHNGARFISVFFPPIGVLMERGLGADFIINVALTSIGYLPGIIHSCYLIDKDEEYEREADIRSDERSKVPKSIVYIVQQGNVPVLASELSHLMVPPYEALAQPKCQCGAQVQGQDFVGATIPATSSSSETTILLPKYESI